jgi:ribose 5-phosphate isomerase B
LHKAEIEALVRRAVGRALGETAAPPSRTLFTEEMARQLPIGSEHKLPPQAVVTPLARQIALERRITLLTPEEAAEPTLMGAGADGKLVALGADHGGFALKEQLKSAIIEAGYGLADCGTHSSDAVDYPDYAYAVARLVADGRAWRGIVIDGAGIGSCMAANKVPGVRAAMCYDQATAVNSREHNDANVLTLGAGLIGPQLAQQIVQVWLKTEFGGGRHARRVDKIEAIGRRYSR